MEDKRDCELIERWKILFKNITIDDVVRILREKTGGFAKENHRGLMGSSAETKGDPQCFDRPMSLPRVFLNDNSNFLSHRCVVCSYVNDRKGSHASRIPDKTTRPQREMCGLMCCVDT